MASMLALMNIVTDFLQYPFLTRALVGIIILGVLTALLGVFVVLRRMAFFGDAIAHSSLAGIALGLAFGASPTIGAITFSVLVALGIVGVSRRRTLALETVIGVFFAAAVSLGVLLISELRLRVDLLGFLFGDILALQATDLWIIAFLGLAVLVLLARGLRQLVQISFSEDLARVSGIPVEFYEYLFMALLALVIALGIKVAGVILVGPLLIIPAAAAKNMAYDLRSMFGLSVLFGLIAGILGLLLSYRFDLAAGPTIILLAAAIFFLTFLPFKPTSP